jgi:hypothetical protein
MERAPMGQAARHSGTRLGIHRLSRLSRKTHPQAEDWEVLIKKITIRVNMNGFLIIKG